MTFNATTFSERRNQLIEKIDASGVILLLGNDESPRNYIDNPYRFRQDSSFLYFCGLPHPGLAITIDLSTGTTTLWGTEPTIDHVIWMGPQKSLLELATSAGITHTASIQSLPDQLASWQKDSSVHFLPPYRADRRIWLANSLQIAPNKVHECVSIPLIEAVITMRSIKSAAEVAEIEKALTITAHMHIYAMRHARPGMLEATIKGAVEGIATQYEGDLAYPSIITINGQVLHNHAHHHLLQEGQLLLGDFGAETKHNYASDITRTIPVSQTFTEQQKEIYQIVLNGLELGIQSIKPGISYQEIHLNVAKAMANNLKAIGIMQGDVEDAVAQGAHALFFPHGLGHMLGMDVHDMEDLGENKVGYGDHMERSQQFGLKALRLGRVLKPGFVLTVEPGLYFIPALIDQWQAQQKHTPFINYSRLSAYRNFGGIRIEDDVLVTDHGNQILGPPIPKTVNEITALRAEAF